MEAHTRKALTTHATHVLVVAYGNANTFVHLWAKTHGRRHRRWCFVSETFFISPKVAIKHFLLVSALKRKRRNKWLSFRFDCFCLCIHSFRAPPKITAELTYEFFRFCIHLIAHIELHPVNNNKQQWRRPHENYTFWDSDQLTGAAPHSPFRLYLSLNRLCVHL